LKKLNQEILDIKQNADETKKKLKRLNEDKANTQEIDYKGDDIFSITESIQSILEENQKTFKTVHKSYKDLKKLEDLLNNIIENEIIDNV
jgi:sugar-specific transcriptional regulator TrmB